MQVTTVTTEGNYKYDPHISPFPLIGLYSKQVYWVYIKGGIILYVILPKYYIRKKQVITCVQCDTRLKWVLKCSKLRWYNLLAH